MSANMWRLRGPIAFWKHATGLDTPGFRRDIAGTAPGTATILVEASDYSFVFGGPRVYTGSKIVKVASLTLSGPDRVKRGESATYRATLTGVDPNDVGLKWEKPDSRTGALNTLTGLEVVFTADAYPYDSGMALWLYALDEHGNAMYGVSKHIVIE